MGTAKVQPDAMTQPVGGGTVQGTYSRKQRRKERIDRGIKVRSDDIFALISIKEMLYVALPTMLPIVGLIVLPLVIPTYWQKVFISTSVFALLAMTWDFLSLVGMVSLGQALFFGVGAYCTGILCLYAGLPMWLSIPIASVAGGAICTILLLPLLRLRGVYFAMVTLVLPLILERIIEATRVFGGTEGLSGLPPFPNKWIEIYVIAAVVLAALFGFRRLMSSDYGLILQAIKDNDRAVMSTGINIYWYKAQALFIAGSVAAFAGAYMTHVYMFVGMPAFALDYSIIPIAASVLGGSGTFAGAMLGAFVLVPLSEVLRGIGGLRTVIYSLLLVFFVVVLPEGTFHYVKRKYHQFERWVEVDR